VTPSSLTLTASPFPQDQQRLPESGSWSSASSIWTVGWLWVWSTHCAPPSLTPDVLCLVTHVQCCIEQGHPHTLDPWTDRWEEAGAMLLAGGSKTRSKARGRNARKQVYSANKAAIYTAWSKTYFMQLANTCSVIRSQIHPAPCLVYRWHFEKHRTHLVALLMLKIYMQMPF
jgi:hypothetical protein